MNTEKLRTEIEMGREDVEKAIEKNHKIFKDDMAKMSEMEFQEFREETIRQLFKVREDTNALYGLAQANIGHIFAYGDRLMGEIVGHLNLIAEKFKIVDENLGSAEGNFEIIGKRMYATELFLTCFAHGAMEFMGGRSLSMERKRGIASYLSVKWNEEVDGKLSKARALMG